MKHTLVATMENHPSTFNKVLSLFRCRGFAIDSLAVGHTDVPNIMRLTIVVDGGPSSLIVEVTGTPDKVDSAVQVLRGFGIKEMVRTGVVAMVRGAHVP